MNTLYWFEFIILFIAALLGALAIMPYSLQLLKASNSKTSLKMSLSKILLLSFLQNAALFAIVTGVGLLASRAIGHGAPYIEAIIIGNKSILSTTTLMLGAAMGLGVLSGFILLIADLVFLPHLPEKLVETARKTSLLENLTASFYGGINEELLMRLFGLSVLVWLLSKIWYTTTTIFWVVNILMAIIFGLGHLPALKNLLGKITLIILARTLLLNAPVGLICGWLYWYYGIEAAIIAHFSADIIYHVGGTAVLHRLHKDT